MTGKKHVLTVMKASENKQPIAKDPLITLQKPVVSAKPSRRRLYAGITVALIIGLVIGYAIGSFQIKNLQNQLQDQREKHESLLELMKRPHTIIERGNITWRFTTLDGTQEEWYMPIDAYVYYVNKPKPEEYHVLSTDGQSLQVRNMELFVEPEFFSEVIGSLTDGNTAGDFVQEVFNLRVQLTVYSEEITETPQWCGETMTLGTGDCEDFAILMGSLLMAGNEHAHYSMTIKMVYMDAENPTDPQTANHALIHITYEDGSGEFLDSTSTDVQSPWSEVVGWYFEL